MRNSIQNQEPTPFQAGEMANTTHFTCYDGNGNVTALVNAADGSESARYENGPFVEGIRMTGPMAKLNPIRFSTQYEDDVTGDIKYLFRDLRDASWLNRDPIEERGGENLYGFIANDPNNKYDYLGLDFEYPVSGKIQDGSIISWNYHFTVSFNEKKCTLQLTTKIQYVDKSKLTGKELDALLNRIRQSVVDRFNKFRIIPEAGCCKCKKINVNFRVKLDSSEWIDPHYTVNFLDGNERSDLTHIYVDGAKDVKGSLLTIDTKICRGVKPPSCRARYASNFPARFGRHIPRVPRARCGSRGGGGPRRR